MKYSPKRAKVMELVPPGGCWRDLPEDIQKSYMMKSYYLTGGRTGMARRISWEEPSLTLTTSPSQKQTERCHPDETRPLQYENMPEFKHFLMIGSSSVASALSTSRLEMQYLSILLIIWDGQ
jgi:DNA (cytosine-5)-methyltransferase 1